MHQYYYRIAQNDCVVYILLQILCARVLLHAQKSIVSNTILYIRYIGHISCVYFNSCTYIVKHNTVYNSNYFMLFYSLMKCMYY